MIFSPRLIVLLKCANLEDSTPTGLTFLRLEEGYVVIKNSLPVVLGLNHGMCMEMYFKFDVENF